MRAAATSPCSLSNFCGSKFVEHPAHVGLLHARYAVDVAAAGCRLHWKVTSPELVQANCASGLVVTAAGADVIVVAGPYDSSGSRV